MRILFFTNRIEPGTSGVGDYARLLAAACQRRGHSCGVVAISDAWATETEHTVSPEGVSYFRFKNAFVNKEAFAVLKRKMREFKADWLSLQFVPYSFHRKGFIYQLPKVLNALRSKERLHIMFHEIWTNGHIETSIKGRLIGQLQKQLLCRMLKKWKPNCVHTHAQPYLEKLKALGLKPKKLPLFGNIPPVAKVSREGLCPLLSREGVFLSEEDRKAYWFFGIFGTLPAIWPPEPLFSLLEEAAKREQKKIMLFSLGGIGNEGDRLWRKMAYHYQKKMTFYRVTEPLTPENLSMALQSLDYGIATTPWSLIEKSASCATLLEHGLPVIVNRDDVHFAETSSEFNIPGLYKMKHSLPEELPFFTGGEKRSGVPTASEHFLTDLEALTF